MEINANTNKQARDNDTVILDALIDYGIAIDNLNIAVNALIEDTAFSQSQLPNKRQEILDIINSDSVSLNISNKLKIKILSILLQNNK